MKSFQRILLAVLALTSFQIHAFADFKTEEELSEFVMNYYRAPDPKAVPQALEFFMATPAVQIEPSPNLHYYDMMAYFFARVAQIEPSLLREYEKIFAKAGKPGRNFLYAIYSIFRDKKTEAFLRKTLSFEEIIPVEEKLLIRPFLGRQNFVKKVEDYNYLDFLWVEFFVTGENEALGYIVDVLAWRDTLRDKLQTWLGGAHSEDEKAQLSGLLSRKTGVSFHFEDRTISPPVDLDCLLAASLRTNDPQAADSDLAEIKVTLGLAADDFMKIGTKGAAMWGLQSNALVHPKLAEFINAQAKVRSDKAVYELTIIQKLVARQAAGK